MLLDDPKEAEKPQVEEGPPAPLPKKRRGFAAMDRSIVRALARKGGVTAHEKGTAHRFNHEEARVAGKKGGLAPHRKRGPGPRAPESPGANA